MKTYKLMYYKQLEPKKWIKEELEISLVDKDSAQSFLDKKFPFNKTKLINVERVRLKSNIKKDSYYVAKENKKEKNLKKAEDYKLKKEKKHAKNLIHLEKKQKKEKLEK